MKFLARIIVLFIGNIAGLLLAAHFIKGFSLSPEPRAVLMVALTLYALNLLVKPFLKLLLTPLIILTLGLALIAVNAIILLVLDIVSAHLTILGILPLFLAAFVIGIVNLVFHLGTKK